MYVPDNYDQFILEDRRLCNSTWTCEGCHGEFTDDELDDLNYCEACQDELEEEQQDEI